MSNGPAQPMGIMYPAFGFQPTITMTTLQGCGVKVLLSTL